MGTIYRTPFHGRNNINLWEFEASDVRTVGGGNKKRFGSHIRNNARLVEKGAKPHVGAPPTMRCDSCDNTFGDLCGYTRAEPPPPTYRVVMVNTWSEQLPVHFCWDCASSRDRMIDACARRWGEDVKSYVAPDGNDVFAFIEQTLFEDSIANLGDDLSDLRCHFWRRPIPPPYNTMVGGRLLLLRERDKYDGPVRPNEYSARYLQTQSSADLSLSDQIDEDTTDVAPSRTDWSSVQTTSDTWLTSVESELSESGFFDPTDLEDARQRIKASIVRRYGQSTFREHLLLAYQGRCAITRCDVAEALEAAHIIPYQGDVTNHPSNGLLLRGDIHTLFDLGLLTVDSTTMTVIIAPRLQGTAYGDLAGSTLYVPQDVQIQPSPTALEEHRRHAGL